MNRMNGSESRCIHPVVAEHPITGKRYLNVNETFTRRIVGVSEEESRVILEMLFGHVRHPRYQVRHRWSVGDLVVWDNLATQHFAVGDYADYRLMHRVTVGPSVHRGPLQPLSSRRGTPNHGRERMPAPGLTYHRPTSDSRFRR